MPFNIHSVYNWIFKVWRRDRFLLFLRLIRPLPDETILDIGGYPWVWAGQKLFVREIVTLNLHPVPWTSDVENSAQIVTMVGDGCALGLASQSYDVGYSNSVIEHVGSWDRQQQFALEIRRVAKRLWVQTPAYECPFEPHLLMPFIHYLPARFRKWMIRRFTLRGWLEPLNDQQIDELVENTQLLTKKQMRQLFPDCEIITERLFWVIPKSYVAIRR
jgi:hypothetical protein